MNDGFRLQLSMVAAGANDLRKMDGYDLPKAFRDSWKIVRSMLKHLSEDPDLVADHALVDSGICPSCSCSCYLMPSECYGTAVVTCFNCNSQWWIF